MPIASPAAVRPSVNWWKCMCDAGTSEMILDISAALDCTVDVAMDTGGDHSAPDDDVIPTGKHCAGETAAETCRSRN